MANSADPDQLASSEANRSGSTVCKDSVYPGSAGQGLKGLYPGSAGQGLKGFTSAADDIFKIIF